MSTEIEKPSLPPFKWDDANNFWDEDNLFWDGSGYPDIDKPVMKNFLLTQSGDYLVFQDDDQINIGGGIYDEVDKPTASIYTEVTKPS